MDVLSDVLRAVRLTGAIFFDIHASAPWVAETPAGRVIVGGMFPGAGHLIAYHAVTRGGCWGGVVGEPPVWLEAGDVIVFPHGDSHVVASAPGMRTTPQLAFYRPPPDGRLPFALTMGPSGAASAHLVCGFLACDARPFNPLLDALPRVMHVRDREDGSLGGFVRFALRESQQARPGGRAALGRLSELLFVEVIRRHVETLPPDRADWLAGLQDPAVGRALAALHADPARTWTLAALARAAGASRSVLAERFTSFVGQPPMQYLTSWRMQLAAGDLGAGRATVAAIAERVGYESDASFSRAFRKAVGMSPRQWRARSAADRPRSRRGARA